MDDHPLLHTPLSSSPEAPSLDFAPHASPQAIHDIELCRRMTQYICHHLISSLSAIFTGCDLLFVPSTEGQDILLMMKQAASSLKSRIEFFRTAYGMVADDSLTVEQVYNMACNYFVNNDRKIQVFWPEHDSNASWHPSVGLIVLHAVLWVADRVSASTPASMRMELHDNAAWQLIVEAKSLNYTDTEKQILQKQQLPLKIEVRELPAYMMVKTAHQYGVDFQASLEKTKAVFTFPTLSNEE